MLKIGFYCHFIRRNNLENRKRIFLKRINWQYFQNFKTMDIDGEKHTKRKSRTTKRKNSDHDEEPTE